MLFWGCTSGEEKGRGTLLLRFRTPLAAALLAAALAIPAAAGAQGVALSGRSAKGLEALARAVGVIDAEGVAATVLVQQLRADATLWGNADVQQLLTQIGSEPGAIGTLAGGPHANLIPVLEHLQGLPPHLIPGGNALPAVGSTAAHRMAGACAGESCPTVRSLAVDLGDIGALARIGTTPPKAPVLCQAAQEAIAKGWTTEADVRMAQRLAEIINPEQRVEIGHALWTTIGKVKAAQSGQVASFLNQLPRDWYMEPWYYVYPQYFGATAEANATWDDLIEHMLPYLERQGFKNAYILPHYQTRGGDDGYDVTAYLARDPEGFDRFMKAAIERGIRVATDFPIGHTSTEHPWFQAALEGDERYINYYLPRPGMRKVDEISEGGDLFAVYEHPTGERSERYVYFPQTSTDHLLTVEVEGQGPTQFYRTFYPFQVDLNLQNPEVLREIFEILGAEANQGIVGKRWDAALNWVKKPGTRAEGLPEAHALMQLFKLFNRHVSAPSVTIPEVALPPDKAAEFFGRVGTIAGTRTTTNADAIWFFGMQGAIRETTYLRTASAFFEMSDQVPQLPETATFFLPFDHHDEAIVTFVREPNRDRFLDYVVQRGGVVFKDGTGVGGRMAEFLDNDPQRIALAMFVQYMAPGAPITYYGAEAGIGHDFTHAINRARHRTGVLSELGLAEMDPYDPREVMRGPFSVEQVRAAEAADDAPLRTTRLLNQLSHARPAMGSQVRPEQLVQGDHEVLTLVRRSQSDLLIGLANLSDAPKIVRIPLAELKAKADWDAEQGLMDALGNSERGRGSPAGFRVDGEDLVITLEPHEFQLLEPALVP